MSTAASEYMPLIRALAFSILFFCQITNAHTVIEPFVGLNFGKWETKTSTSSQTAEMRGDVLGFGYGLRAIQNWRIFFVGFEYSGTIDEWKYKDISGSGLDDGWSGTKARKQNIGVILGPKSPSEIFYVQVGYYPFSSVTLDSNHIPGESAPTYSGSTIGIGVLALIKNTWKVGLEYRQSQFNNIAIGSKSGGTPLTSDGSRSYESLTHPYYFVTVGIPISITGKSTSR